MLDLIIKGGTVVAPGGAGLMDVGIQGEQIAAVASPGALDDIGAGETIDATGMIVLPPAALNPMRISTCRCRTTGPAAILASTPSRRRRPAGLPPSGASPPTWTSPGRCR